MTGDSGLMAGDTLAGAGETHYYRQFRDGSLSTLLWTLKGNQSTERKPKHSEFNLHPRPNPGGVKHTCYSNH